MQDHMRRAALVADPSAARCDRREEPADQWVRHCPEHRRRDGDDRPTAADFMRDRGLTSPSVFDSPGGSLQVVRRCPRNTVPSPIVLDRQHRGAAVFLTAVPVTELTPLAREVVVEPAVPTGTPS
jgi:hypothetical protein